MTTRAERLEAKRAELLAVATKIGHGPGTVAWEQEYATRRVCRGPHVSEEVLAAKNAALAPGGAGTDEARRLDAQRLPCGFDRTLYMLAFPQEGQDESGHNCPGCGMEFSFRAGTYDLVDEDDDEE